MASGGRDGDGVIPAVAESQYVSTKISVWWDIENCQVHKDCDPHNIAQNISSALVKLNYCGPVSISAYGDTNRIPSSVQHALSSTGISLNHVPAGVKDASDKKILVDMLFWAVDNPAPANYLLISGDRDFSNALHQLRMRRYNILLAQNQTASAPLVAAAKSVWLWTNLLAGGQPLTNGELQHLCSRSYALGSDSLQFPDSNQIRQPVEFYNEKNIVGNQKFPNTRRCDDFKKGKSILRNSCQPRSWTSPNGVEDQNHRQPQYPFTYDVNVPLSGTRPNFVQGNLDPSWRNGNSLQGNYQNHHPLPVRSNSFPIQPSFAPGNFYPPNHASHPFPTMPSRPDGPGFSSSANSNVPDIGKLNISRNPSQNPALQQEDGELKRNYSNGSMNTVSIRAYQNGRMIPSMRPLQYDTLNNRYPQGSKYLTSSSAENFPTNIPGNAVWGTPGCPNPSEYVQGLIGVILLALSTLKSEKILPTEANITDCIYYGDPKHQNTDVKKALDCAIEQHMIVKRKIGTDSAVDLFLGKNENIWKCVNPIGGNPKQYPKATWDELEKYLTSPAGKSAIIASRCRYEAAIILKNTCLKELALGEILQILDIVITVKKWIVHYQTGWQPIKITVAENNS